MSGGLLSPRQNKVLLGGEKSIAVLVMVSLALAHP